MISKKQVVAQLEETAQLLDLLGEDSFRAKSFANAARQLEAFEGNFEELFYQKRLTEIRGIGKTLAGEVYLLGDDYDLIPSLEALHTKVPESVRDLFRVAGLGPKKVAALWQSGIGSLAELLEAAQDGRIAKLKGFGAKSAENILESTRFVLANQSRMRLDLAEAYSQAVLNHLAQHLPKARIDIAGELRRCCETVEQLEFVVTGITMTELYEVTCTVLHSVSVNENILTAKLEIYPVRIVLCDPEAFGAVHAYQTGNAEYVEALQKKAIAKGLALTSRDLYKHNQRLSTESEKQLFDILESPFLIPELRESARLEYPQNIITLGDIHGMVHNHSSWSDAENSIREMAHGAQERGYSYLAMADHSRTSYYANGLSIERLIEQAREIDLIRQELKDQGLDFELLHGIEVDILSDGSLDYPNDVLDLLDYTVVSVHQNFTLSEELQTRRIIRAVQHPKAKILGHMTGRLLLRRQGYALDIQAVVEACAESKTVIEINANPYRLDLDWRWVIKAKELGCKFSINPDAHALSGFDDIRYGVMMARKAGLSPDDVVNTAPTGKAFLSLLKQ
jgi:DNA polymerase (family 10)